MRVFAVVAVGLVLGACSSTALFTRPAPVYAVFFDAHEQSLTRDGRKIVDDAAAEAKLHADRTLEISGPSTRAAPGYDARLAEARILVVEQALMDDGIAPKRLVRASSTTSDLRAGKTGAQRVEIRLLDRPAS